MCEVTSCTTDARCHVLFTAGRRRGAAKVCGPCLLAVLTGRAVAHGRKAFHIADHPVSPECRHPESRWVDDHCEIDGLVLVDMSDLGLEVPA